MPERLPWGRLLWRWLLWRWLLWERSSGEPLLWGRLLRRGLRLLGRMRQPVRFHSVPR